MKLKFKWEKDNWVWELLRLDEFGLPKKYNFIVPDKLMHFIMTFGLSWFFTTWFGPALSCFIG
jgi:hypothetical protein